METCFRCDRTKEEVKLLDVIYNNEIVKVCEECALIEDLPVIRRPNSHQLLESEKPYTVRERLRRMAGLKDDKQEKVKEVMRKISDVKIDDLRKPKDYKKILEEKYELARKKNKPVNLIDNFNWSIMMGRKKRRIDRKQLAEAIGESETAIKMIENKEMPDDFSRIISKIEQYFGIKLRKEEEESDRVRESIKEKLQRNKGGKINEPAVVLKFDKETAKNITIADLKKLKDERKKVEEKIEDVIWSSKKEEKKDESNESRGEIEFED